MSHFSVLIIGDDPEKQLAPYHEFECTGTNDEYVQDVDVTAKVRELMTKPRGYGDDKDKPYDLEGALDYYGLSENIVEDESEVDRKEDHKFGFAVVKAGELVRVVDRTNPNKKWDWWELGGRWTGYLKLKDGRVGSVGRPGLMTDAAKEGRTDQALKSDIDFDAMRDEDERKARKRYRNFYKALGDHPLPAPWKEIREAHADIELARKTYHEQPGYKAIRAVEEFRWSDDVGLEFGCTEDEYATRARQKAGVTFAIIHQGKWYERGKMGWFGWVADEKDQDSWSQEFSKLLDSISPEALLSVVDCHI